jgi:hypothetical protein
MTDLGSSTTLMTETCLESRSYFKAHGVTDRGKARQGLVGHFKPYRYPH